MAGMLRKGITMADVGCAGILVADTFCGPMASLPQAGQLVAVEPFRRSAGGCAANVAIDLAKQGVSVDIAGCLGRDVAGEMVLAELQSSGIGFDRVIYSEDTPTSETVILLVAGEDRRFVHNFGANARFSVQHIDPGWMRGLRVFYLGGLFALPDIDIQALANLLDDCRTHGVITVIDVVIPHAFENFDGLKQLLERTDYFLPNDDEAQIITGETSPHDQLRALPRWAPIAQLSREVATERWQRGAITIGSCRRIRQRRLIRRARATLFAAASSPESCATGICRECCGTPACWELPRHKLWERPPALSMARKPLHLLMPGLWRLCLSVE